MARRNPHRPHASQLRLLPETFPSRGSMVLAAGRLLVSDDRSLAAWQPLGVEAVRQRYSNEDTAALVVGNVVRLFRYLGAHGVHTYDEVTQELVTRWSWAGRPDRYGLIHEVCQTTARNRQWAAFVCFCELALLGCPIDPVALIGQRIPRPPASVSARPLDDEEDRLVCRNADTGLIGSQRSLVVAGSRTGGSLPEVASIRASDVDLSAATITFRGEAARTNSMDEWSAQTVLHWWNGLPEQPQADDLVCVTKKTTTVKDAAKSVGVRLGSVLHEAGIKHRPGVSAGSIRLTGARRVFESSGIEAAARFLGNVSLDRTAEALRHNWRGHGNA